MENKKSNLEKIAISILAILLLSSTIALIANSTGNTGTVSAAVPTNLLPYEWTSVGGSQTVQQYSAGPAPNRPDVLWSATLYPSGSPSGEAYAFDGKLFAMSTSAITAYDPMTGAYIWNCSLPSGYSMNAGTGGSPSFFKIDDTYAGAATARGPVFINYKTGTLAGITNYNTTITGVAVTSLSVSYYHWWYDSDDKVVCEYCLNLTSNQAGVMAFDCSNPASPAPIKWYWWAPTGVEVMCCGGGKVFVGGYGEGEVFALNGSTGKLIWRAFKEGGNAGYSGIYYEGRFYQSASGTTIACWNATTGAKIFEVWAGARAFFAYGGCMAYGRYYEANIFLPYGFFGCWDAYTGALLWQTSAFYQIAYLNPVVADGKVYCSLCDQAAGNVVAGARSPGSTFACMDAFTGEVIWKIPLSVAHPMVAYGNLYLIISGRVYCIGDSTQAWGNFHNGADQGVAYGQSGPTSLKTPLWTYTTGGPVTGSCVADNGMVYFGSFDGHVYAINAQSGIQVWNFSVGTNPLYNRLVQIRSTPATSGGKVFIGPDDGYVYALNANTGALLWKTPANMRTDPAGLDVVAASEWQMRSSPIVVGNRLYVGSLDSYTYCLDTTSGSVVWKTPTNGNFSWPVLGTPLVVNNTVYIESTFAPGTAQGVPSSSPDYIVTPLYSLNAATGAVNWIQTFPHSGFGAPVNFDGTPAIASNNTLIVPYSTNRIALINATTGARLVNMSIPTPAGSTSSLTGGSMISWTPTVFWNGSQTLIYSPEDFFVGCYYINSTTLDIDIANGLGVTRAANASFNCLNCTFLQFLGHQSFSSVALVPALANTGPGKIYIGDQVESITLLNSTNGAPLSNYCPAGEVPTSGCVYEGGVYFGCADYNVYAFKDIDTNPMYLHAASNKGDTMWNTETLNIAGRLTVAGSFDYFGELNPSYAVGVPNGLPNATVTLTMNKPDGTIAQVNATTNNYGYFSFSYSPTTVGNWGWVVAYSGVKKPAITYAPAYSEFYSVSVTAAPGSIVVTPSPTASPTPTPVVTASPTPVVTESPTPEVTASPTPVVTESPTPAVTASPTPEITPTATPAPGTSATTYAIVAVIVIVILAIAAYFVMRMRKKK